METREIKFRLWDGKEMHNVAGLSWRDVTGYGEPERPARDKIQDIDFAEFDKGGWNAPYFIFFANSPEEYESEFKKAEIEVKEHEELISKMVLMQYTGLKDKNGKEIFDGDIVNADGDILQIVFGIPDEQHDGSKFIIPMFYGRFIDGSDWVFVERDNEVEVIGNIYEHSHLLESK